MTWRLICSPASDGPTHMALDEALLCRGAVQHAYLATLRLYTWQIPWMTIGYFQNHDRCCQRGLPLTRRLTGGLTVVHGDDLSFSFVVHARSLSWIYDQMDIYRHLHGALRRALNALGIPARDAADTVLQQHDVHCRATIYPADVMLEGRKILGSCIRRRGQTLLVEGSIHLPHLASDPGAFMRACMSSFSHLLHDDLVDQACPTPTEMALMAQLRDEKYVTDAWNRKR